MAPSLQKNSPMDEFPTGKNMNIPKRKPALDYLSFDAPDSQGLVFFVLGFNHWLTCLSADWTLIFHFVRYHYTFIYIKSRQWDELYAGLQMDIHCPWFV